MKEFDGRDITERFRVCLENDCKASNKIIIFYDLLTPHSTLMITEPGMHSSLILECIPVDYIAIIQVITSITFIVPKKRNHNTFCVGGGLNNL